MSDTPKKFDSTPGYNDGWFNGDPKQMIKVGTYDQHRDRMSSLKYSPEEIAVFDKLNEVAKLQRKKEKTERDEIKAKAAREVAKSK